MTNVLDYENIIKDTVRKMRVQAQDRDDVVQDCFVKLLENQEEIDRARSPGAFVRRMCMNLILDRAEYESYRAWPSIDEPRYLHRMLNHEGGIEVKTTEEKLQDAIMELPYDLYQVIYAVYIEGKTEPVTGKELGVSHDAVNRKKQKGIVWLREYFEKQI